MPRIRITVLKQLEVPDLAAEYAPAGSWGKCWMEEARVFEVEGGSDYPTPEGFCSWAWADIHRDVTMLRYGADPHWIRVPGTMISSCTDGRKPVVFKIERIDDESQSLKGGT
jgi:uncharacterized repeat protein (TIGR04076 family)